MTPFEKAVEAVSTQIAADCEGGDLPPSAYTSTAKRALTAALSALESEGWVLVPVEPTVAMEKAWIDCGGGFAMHYRAMLASRPAPTAPASEG